jgi:hypothetical protein
MVAEVDQGSITPQCVFDRRYYGAFVNWLTNRTLTLAPLPKGERGSFYCLSLWGGPARESAAGEGRVSLIF